MDSPLLLLCQVFYVLHEMLALHRLHDHRAPGENASNACEQRGGMRDDTPD